MSSIAAPFGLRPISRFGSGSQEVFRQYPIASGYATDIAAGHASGRDVTDRYSYQRQI